jgi:hypothetical protein
LLAAAAASSCFLARMVLILPRADAGLVASLPGVYALAFGGVSRSAT